MASAACARANVTRSASSFTTPPEPASALRFPARVLVGHADRARTVTRGAGLRLVEKKNPIGGVTAARERPQRRRAIEPAVDLRFAMSAELAAKGAGVGFAVRAD